MTKPISENLEMSHDLIVLSDLHLGEGLHKNEPRYSPTEDFFHDRQFANFLFEMKKKHAHDPSSLVLVLNGDTFDFLTVTNTPSAKEAAAYGYEVTPAEKQFGLNPTAQKSVYKLDTIARGHKLFFHALARFIKGGHRVEIVRGNHDLELHFPEVRKRLIEILAEFYDGPDITEAKQRVHFHEWFYFEPNRIYIEHGNQYDTTNSIRYPLHPVLPPRKWWRTGGEEALDYPLGSIFVRFFYNRVRQIDPYTPRLLSFEQYLDFVRRYNLFDVWRIYRDHYPHFAAALGHATTTGSSRSSEKEDARQKTTFQKLADENHEGNLYEKLSELKTQPASASKPFVVGEMIAPLVRRILWFGLFAFVSLVVWFGILQLIDNVPGLTANAILMSIFAMITMAGAAWAWIHLQRKLSRTHGGKASETLVERAEKIAQLVNAPMVLMGHTHMVDYKRINNGQSVYANSGTWTSVENPWNRIMRDARRLTFLHVKGLKVELSRWNDDADRIDTVPLFYVENENIPDNLSSEPPFKVKRTKEHSWLPSASISIEDDDHPYDDPPTS